MKEILNRKNELTQLEIVKVIEAMINLEQTGGLMMASQLQIMLSKSIENVLQSGKDLKSPDNDTTSLFFLIRFWGNFVQIPNSDKFIQEELLKKSLEYIISQIQALNGLSGGGGTQESSKIITDRDFRNILHIIEFCLKHDNFPSHALIKETMNELLIEFDHSAFRFRQETQEFFI
jgi:hypothetical protein